MHRSYRCTDNTASEWFVKKLVKIADLLESIHEKPVPIKKLTKEHRNYLYAKVCHICGQEGFDRDDNKLCKVCDHCHYTGRYRGAAHNICNLKYRHTNTVSVVFHNLSGYDSHFLIKAVACFVDEDLNLLPLNKKKYILFTKKLTESKIKFKFIDSFKFMSSSLDKLASYLTFLHISIP